MFESEERRIVERIKYYIKDEEHIRFFEYIMLRNKRILDIADYRRMVSNGKINPRDAYVYFGIGTTPFKSAFYYPFLVWHSDILNAYLSKLEFYYKVWIVQATGLKYVVNVEVYEKYLSKYLSIEVVNLDTAVNNLNLPKIVVEVLDGKLVSGEKELTDDEIYKVYNMYKSQRLIAGYGFDGALGIIHDYYDNDNKSLAKEVARIAMEYYRIFQPYTVCYDMNNWKELDCWSIK